MATFLSVTETNKKKFVALAGIPCIYYMFCFWKNTADIRALIDLDSKVNAKIPVYALKLSLKVRHINVKAQKIDGSAFEMFRRVLASF